MKFIEVMEKRHSSRDFKKDEVSEDTLREIVKIAGMSPSWENSQPWNVYIATGETLETIRETWVAENDKKIKGSADMNPGHRTNFSDDSCADSSDCRVQNRRNGFRPAQNVSAGRVHRAAEFGGLAGHFDSLRRHEK